MVAMNNIFVFGSNLAGRHGKGSALEAVRKHGAIYGIGIGLQGNSYAIPTKDKNLQILSLEGIAYHIEYFELFAFNHSQFKFNVVAIGCGLAGYRTEQIRPLFKYRPQNVKLPKEFLWDTGT
jgi:hypothetical protein